MGPVDYSRELHVGSRGFIAQSLLSVAAQDLQLGSEVWSVLWDQHLKAVGSVLTAGTECQNGSEWLDTQLVSRELVVVLETSPSITPKSSANCPTHESLPMNKLCLHLWLFLLLFKMNSLILLEVFTLEGLPRSTNFQGYSCVGFH